MIHLSDANEWKRINTLSFPEERLSRMLTKTENIQISEFLNQHAIIS